MQVGTFYDINNKKKVNNTLNKKSNYASFNFELKII